MDEKVLKQIVRNVRAIVRADGEGKRSVPRDNGGPAGLFEYEVKYISELLTNAEDRQAVFHEAVISEQVFLAIGWKHLLRQANLIVDLYFEQFRPGNMVRKSEAYHLLTNLGWKIQEAKAMKGSDDVLATLKALICRVAQEAKHRNDFLGEFAGIDQTPATQANEAEATTK